MLKVILIAFLITGYTCTVYHKNAYENYLEQIVDPQTLPPAIEVFNNKPQSFEVTRKYEGLTFRPVDLSVALGFKTNELPGDEIILRAIIFKFGESATHMVLKFEMAGYEFGGPVYFLLSTEVFSPPKTEELKEHAKKHAVNLEPLTREDVQTLKEQPDRMSKLVELNVQWIQDLLNGEKPPVASKSPRENTFTYVSPPTVMNADVLNQLEVLENTMNYSE